MTDTHVTAEGTEDTITVAEDATKHRYELRDDGRVIGVPQPATSTPSVTSQQASQTPSVAPSAGH